ncbi:MAG: mechanosensitive ion channel, partial [Alphaproteobacteria bacterium]|nr:mechanosensitive ion channel [Alphaproteobacteria bacterium]
AGWFLLALLAMPPGTLAAEPAMDAPPTATPMEAEALLKTLENEEEREPILERLRTLVATSKQTEAAPPEESIGMRVTTLLATRVQAVGANLQSALAVLADAPKVWQWIKNQATSEAARERWLNVLFWLVPVLGTGLLAEWMARLLLARPRKSVEDRATESLGLRIILLAARSVLDLLPIAAFAAGAYGVLLLIGSDDKVRLVVMILINANLLARAIHAASRMVLVPHVSSLRLLPLSDETARYIYIWVERFTLVAVYGFFILAAGLALGLTPDSHAGLAKILGLVLAAMGVIFILQNRKDFAGWLRRASGAFAAKDAALRGLRNRFADIWHVFAILYILAAFTIWTLEIEGGFAFTLRATLFSIGTVLAAWVALAILHRLIDRAFRVSDALKTGAPGLEERANRYLAFLHYVARYAVLVLVVLGLLESWGIDAFSWVATETGQRILVTLATIAVVVFAAALLSEFVISFVERQLEKSDQKNAAAKARAQTLLPLLRTTIIVVIAVVATMIVLSELGLNIAPLIAGAGVVGLAVGFGAQALVKDVITGVFILMEDQMAVGDVVQIGTHAGLVEGLSIRTIRLRDLGGNVHTIPFSTVDTVLNMTKEFSYALFEIGIAYREDVDAVIPVLKDIAAGMQEDEAYTNQILEPLEVLGLDRFDDSAVVIKARMKTVPLQQWAVGREFNRRMKRRFDELGIEIPFPHRTVYQGEADRVFKGLDHPPKEPTAAKSTRKGGGRGGVSDDSDTDYH